MVLFDDIGSYPPPDGVKREQVQEAFNDFECNKERLFKYIQDAMQDKINAGVEIPNYPQFQDMNQQFLRYINDPQYAEQPFVVKESAAKIVELDAIEAVARKYSEEKGEPLKLRVCVTGPLELHFHTLGSTIFRDVLFALAKSTDRFVKNSIIDTKFMKTHTVSIDEPSLGISPFSVEKEDVTKALDIATQSAAGRGIDVQIHLHSPLQYNLICDAKNINVIGVESAATPQYLDIFDKKDLEIHDKFLRAGIARTDIFKMAAEVSERHKTDVWKDKSGVMLARYLDEVENPAKITERLKYAYNKFRERIKYAGPDCGLGTWPSQSTAFKLLENTAKGVKLFRQQNI